MGPMGQEQAGWNAILNFLQRDVHWLGRHNAVSVHRTMDLINATPETWLAHQEGADELPQSGRLARLLEADLALHHVALVALEWSPTTQDEGFVQLDTLPEDPAAGFNLFGYADRVDVVAVPDEQRVALEERGVLGDDDHTTPYPLHGEGRPAKRLVVIRDLKTVAEAEQGFMGLRHMRCLFEDPQLALYARAWELLHPNDRVVGVGATEVGEFTTHYVELDSDLASVADDLEIGEITQVFAEQFPAETLTGASTTPFRRWMAERLAVAQRPSTPPERGTQIRRPASTAPTVQSLIRALFPIIQRRFLMVEFNNSQRLGLDLDRHIALMRVREPGKPPLWRNAMRDLFAAEQRDAPHATGPRRPCPDLVHCGTKARANRRNGLAGLAALRGRRHHLHP